MPLAGRAFLALWNDIVPEREAEYDRWHTFQHVPERVAAPGFRGARRYVNRGRGEHRHFTLYELHSLDALQTPEYRELVEDPTPWSASMRPDFRNFVRAPCTVESTWGLGIGAAIAIACVDAAVGQDVVDSALERLQAAGRIVGVHVGRRHAAGSAIAFGRPPAATVRPFDRVVLIEGLDRDAAQAALDDVVPSLGLPSSPRDFGSDVYDLAFVFPGHDADERLAHRRASWLASKASRQ